MKKKTIYWVIAIIVVLVIIAIVATPKTETAPSGEAEEVVPEVPEEGVLEEGVVSEGIEWPLFIPGPGDTSEEEGLAIPDIVDGGTPENPLLFFQVMLKDGRLFPSEFRIKVGDPLRIGVTNQDDKDYELNISGMPSHDDLRRSLKARSTEIFTFQEVSDEGMFDVACTGCPEKVVGKIVVFPKEKE